LQAEQSSIRDLPANLLVAIFEHLDGRSLLKAVPTACKAWYAAYKGAVHKLDVSCVRTLFKADSAAAWLVQHGHTLSELVYQYRPYDNFTPNSCHQSIFSALVQLTQLRSLDLEGLKGCFRTKDLTCLQMLTSLRLAYCDLPQMDLAPLSALVGLCKLSLEGSMHIDTEDWNFDDLARALTQLTSFKMGEGRYLENPWRLSELKFVQELDLSSVPDLQLDDLPEMPSLTKLTFRTNLAHLESFDTGTKLSRLQHLDMLESYFGTSARALASLVSLTRLVAVTGGEHLWDDMDRLAMLTAVGPLQQLRHLAISSDFQQADPISSFSVLGTLQHLTHLELRGPQLPAGALAAMFSTSQGDSGASCLRKLRCLRVEAERCVEMDWQAQGGSISRSDVALLVRTCPELQSVTLSRYLVEDAGLLQLSGLTGLTSLTFRVVMAGNHKGSHPDLRCSWVALWTGCGVLSL
jgi:hypothetical protein